MCFVLGELNWNERRMKYIVISYCVVDLLMAVTVFIFRAMIIANTWYYWLHSARVKKNMKEKFGSRYSRKEKE